MFLRISTIPPPTVPPPTIPTLMAKRDVDDVVDDDVNGACIDEWSGVKS